MVGNSHIEKGVNGIGRKGVLVRGLQFYLPFFIFDLFLRLLLEIFWVPWVQPEIYKKAMGKERNTTCTYALLQEGLTIYACEKMQGLSILLGVPKK